MNERSHCPYLGLRQNRAIRFASPTSEHRCYVSGEAQDIPVDQRTHCLSINHLSCPLYTGEWSGTTTGAVAGAGAMAFAGSRSRGRLASRESLFYLAVVGLIFTITLVWVGIYYLYMVSGTEGPVDTVVVLPTATATDVPPTTTAVPTVTPTVDTPPSSPSGLTAVASVTGVALNWNRNNEADLDGYDVFRADAINGQYTKLNPERLQRLETDFIDDSAPAGKRVQYRVVAVDKAGQSSQAATIEVPTLDATATTVPTSTLTPEPPTLTPTTQIAPSPVPPSPTAQVIYVPGPPVEVTRVVVPTTQPSSTPTSIPTPTNTTEPTATYTPEPTAWATPVPAATETPVPPPPTATQPLPEPAPEPSVQASAPSTETMPTIEQVTAPAP